MIDSIIEIKGHKVVVVKYFEDYLPPSVAEEWFCMYIEIDPKLKSEYSTETFRKNNIVGVDTHHMCFDHLSLNRKYDAAIAMITELIDDYSRLAKYF